MLTLGNGPDPALCRFSKISDRNSKFHLDGILEQKCFGASQMCDAIAINANLPWLVWSLIARQYLSTHQEKNGAIPVSSISDERSLFPTSTIALGTGRVTSVSAASLAARSLLILAPPPEDLDDPNESPESLLSSLPISDICRYS